MVLCRLRDHPQSKSFPLIEVYPLSVHEISAVEEAFVKMISSLTQQLQALETNDQFCNVYRGQMVIYSEVKGYSFSATIRDKKKKKDNYLGLIYAAHQ